MKKSTTKRSTKPFVLKVWRQESYRKVATELERKHAAYYTFTNTPDAQQIANFKRVLWDVTAFERLHGNRLVEVELAIKEKRLADAGHELKKRRLVST